jgi:spermidine synthase
VRPAAAAIVVFLAAAAVLMLEILAVRLMAPYVGVSLNTYTGIIGTVLAGISAGAWIGGWAADRVDPRKLLGPILIVGGVLALLTAPLTTLLGEGLKSDSLKAIVALSAATVFLPAFVLSGVTPIVVKMQLQSLKVTGSIVGRMSAFGTAGALVGTFGTGFFLSAQFPTRSILAGVGAILIVAGAILWWQLMRRAQAAAAVAVVLAAAGAGGAAAAVHGPCKVESPYACVQVVTNDAGGRSLILDNLIHSLVIPNDPKQLTLPYTYVMGAALNTIGKPGAPINALHIGGGAFMLPRYIAATRPGSTNTVMEIDPAVIDTAKDDFGVRESPSLRIREGDARLLVGDERPGSYDVVIGDAFSGRSVPWQLTTREFLDEVEGLLRPGGMYLMNFIDTKLDFVKAEAATLSVVFSNVALFDLGTSHVLVASNAPLPLAAIDARLAVEGPQVRPVTGGGLRSLIGDAQVLKDDFAPVDQLLN